MELSGRHTPAAVQLSARWVLAALDRFRRRAAWGELRAWLLMVAAAVLVALLLLVALDHAWPGGLPRRARLAAIGTVGVGALAGIARGEWQRRRRALGRMHVAQRLERAAAIRHNSLINALALRDTAAAAYAETAAFQQAARDLMRAPPVEALAVGIGRAPLLSGGLALAAWLLYAAFAVKPIGPALLRVLGWERPPAAATQLRLVRPGPDDAVHAGEPVMLEFAILGRPARRAELTLGTAGGFGNGRTYAAALELDPDADVRRARFVLPPHEATHAIRFRCTAGDGLLEGIIPVQPLPSVDRLEIWLEPPAYTGLPAQAAKSPDVTVWSGTVARLALTANVELRDPMVVFVTDRETRTRMRVESATPRTGTVTLLLTESSEYRFEFSDPWGYPYRDPPTYRVTVRADGPPAVRIIAPSEAEAPDGVVSAAAIPDIIAQAEDDLGIAEFTLYVERAGTLERWDLPAGAPRPRACVATWDVAPPGGPDARVWFEARDGRLTLDGRPAPQAARSQTLTILAERAPRADRLRREPGEFPGGKPPATKPSEPDAPDAGGPQSGSDGSATDLDSGDEIAEASTGRSGRDGETLGDTESDLKSPEDSAGGGGDPVKPVGDDDGPQSSKNEPSGDSNGVASQRSPSGSVDAPPAATSSQPADETDGSGADAPEGELEDDPIGRFLREHGREAGEVVRRLREKNGEGQAARSAAPADSPEDSESGPKRDDSDDGNPQPDGETGEATGGQPRGSDGTGARGPADAAPGTDTGSSGSGSARPGDDDSEGDSDGGPSDPPPQTQPTVSDARDPPGSPPRSRLDSAGAQDVIDLLEMLERGAQVTEEMLVDFGWPAGKAAAFVKALERTRAALADLSPGAARRIIFNAALGSVGVQQGVGVAADLRPDVLPDGGLAGPLGRIAPPPEQQVPENLRGLLAAYYRALAERREGPARAGREP